MKFVLFGGVIGGIILFLWGWMAWTVLPLHFPSLHPIDNEDRVTEVLQTNLGNHGVYAFPGMPRNAEASAEEQQLAMDEWGKKYARGPVGMIIYDPHGSDPMMPSQMVNGFIIDLLAALLAAWLLSRSTAEGSSYLARVAYCGTLGILVSLCSHLMHWNWLGFPLDYTTAMVVDAVVGWVLAGLGIAAVVKARAAAPAAA